jgi:hypothetical protein
MGGCVEMNMNSRVVRRSGPIAAPVDNELVMLDIDAGKYYGLNGIASAIWQNLEEEISVGDLCRQLCESYDVGMEQCSAEVLSFLKELETRNLISVE